jgi:hypothetical protein
MLLQNSNEADNIREATARDHWSSSRAGSALSAGGKYYGYCGPNQLTLRPLIGYATYGGDKEGIRYGQ